MTPDTLSPEVLAELAKLHDIRLADPVGWWPLAPGWWGLFVLFVVLGCTALALIARHRRSLNAVALQELNILKQRLAAGTDPQPISIDLAVLLRRISLSSDKRNEAVNITGNEWAGQLAAGEAGLTPQTAEFLAAAPYAPLSDADTGARLTTAFAETERWIRRYA